jgi:hypothetical protein
MMKDLGSYLDLSLLCSFLPFFHLLFTISFIVILDNIIIPTLLTPTWVKPSLGGTTRNDLKEPKTTKSFFWALFVKCFHIYKLLLFHVYHFHALIYGLKFIWELKKLEFLKIS